MRTAWLLLSAATVLPGTALAQPVLAPIWTDGAVIQRDAPIQVDGSAAPNARVSGTLGRASASARTDARGSFTLTFPARAASADPVTLTVRDTDGTVARAGLVVGDVWLCSGQSNMEWTVAAALNGANTIAASTDPLLRMATVPHATAITPSRTFGGPVPWQQASPETTGAFSAACYHMLKNLRDALGIPVGAVHASWGGSQSRPWLSPQAGLALYGAEQMALLDRFERDPLDAVQAFAPQWERWWTDATGTRPWADPASMDWRPVPAIAPWTQWPGDAPPANGNVWFRRTIELTPAQAAGGGVLNIGIIDDLDATWVNGRAVGMTHGWDTERVYRVPPDHLRAGANEIIVAVNNSWGEAGMQSAPDRLSFTAGGDHLSLADGWRYSAGRTADAPPRAPWDANAGIGGMHNRMIAPIGRFAMTGAAWYQGESDVGNPGYADRLAQLFAGWRRQFGANLRVLVVQLADFGERRAEPAASGWAETRDIQRRVAADDAGAALVSAIDLGEPTDIHPANKVVLGQRLALAARGKAMPMPRDARRAQGTVRVRFGGIEGGLVSIGGPHPLGVELCGTTQDSCRHALATIDGDEMTIPDDGHAATRVRHAWADAPIVNLFDGRGLPIPGFELSIAP